MSATRNPVNTVYEARKAKEGATESKIKVFLDTSVVVRLLAGEANLLRLFSEELLSEVTYVTNPIVFQELLIAAERTNGDFDLSDLDQHIELIPVDPGVLDSRFARELRRLRNLAVHSNDVLMIGTAEAAQCEYFLTYDSQLAKAGESGQLKILAPEAFLALLDKR